VSPIRTIFNWPVIDLICDVKSGNFCPKGRAFTELKVLEKPMEVIETIEVIN